MTVCTHRAHFERYCSFSSLSFFFCIYFCIFLLLKEVEKQQGKHFQGNKISTNRQWELLLKLLGIMNTWSHSDGAHISMTNGRGWMEVSVVRIFH